MHSVLFVAKPTQKRADWAEFLKKVDLKLARSDVSRLAENVWLVDLHRSTTSLGWLISSAASQAIAYGMLSFERAPEWLPDGFDPNTTQARSE